MMRPEGERTSRSNAFGFSATPTRIKHRNTKPPTRPNLTTGFVAGVGMPDPHCGALRFRIQKDHGRREAQVARRLWAAGDCLSADKDEVATVLLMVIAGPLSVLGENLLADAFRSGVNLPIGCDDLSRALSRGPAGIVGVADLLARER